MTYTERLETILRKIGTRPKHVSAYGRQVVIDPRKVDRNLTIDAMTKAGFRLKHERDGRHMDGTNGLRLWFTLD